MIPNSSDVVEVQSNVTGETGSFTVDENSLGKIMSVLTNLYSDPELAVVREYLTNALDAQIEAQELDPTYVWRPIEVTTPSHFNKSYIVRDFGTGMSVDDLKEIYSKYGKSTKEQSNSVTGMLGLGSKCALTYTNQFTITGIKNGVMTKAIVSKDENDIPMFMIVDTSTTSEPNGVEISIPVRDRNSFTEKTQNFLKFWKDGQVLVDGREPVKHGYTEVKPGVYLIDNDSPGYTYNRHAPTSYVVMGNVAYAVDDEYVDKGLRDAYLGFVAYVTMGAVDFPPSREKLMYNKRTKDTVSKISEGLFEAILDEKLKEITNAPDHKTAYWAHHNLPSHFARHAKAQSLKYKGDEFIDKHQHDHMVLDWDWKGNGQIGERSWIHVPSAMTSSVIVTGVDTTTKPTSYFKKKVRYYIQQNKLEHDTAILVDKDVSTVWLDWMPRIDADTIKALKLPRNTGTGGPRAEAPYEYYTSGAAGSAATRDEQVTIPSIAGNTMVYISPQDMRETYRKQGTTGMQFMTYLGPNVTLVVLGKNRFDKFCRAYPQAITAKQHVQKLIKEYVDAATDAEYLISELEYGEKEFMKAADVTKINDPELVDIIKMVQAPSLTTHYEKAVNLGMYARRADIHVIVPEKRVVNNKISKRYPLISTVGKREMKHLVIYVNAVYAQEYAPKP